MQKRNLKNLSIKKTSISKLRKTEIKGGPGRKTGNIIVGGQIVFKCKQII